jgi:3-isopropylmalate dehydrogenase
MSDRVLVLPGDGIGPEIMAQARKVLERLIARHRLDIAVEEAPFGGAAVDACGEPLPGDTLRRARAARAVLLGAIGGPKWDRLERRIRPERGILRLRSELGLFANLRPAVLFPQLREASSLRPEVVDGLDLMIVRELIGGIYFGEPRGIRELPGGEREGFNTLVYRESEIIRIGRVAFETARRRRRRLCSVDKANVLEATELWREVIGGLAADFPDVALSHMYVDNAAMQLVRAPTQFDVIVTTNMFGDILSDLASMATGSIGMLPSASLGAGGFGLYEPIHGSAPDIAGRDIANPLAAILSVAMMFRYSFEAPSIATEVEAAVGRVLDRGLRTPDVALAGAPTVSTTALGDAVAAEI